ncbi:unnamed protein product [Clavelina lepadiformis]|uniref:Uncharacterized protein n=1 Tax=Clavelina lepadiformis TaxID=159417 RepID=A0ABP0FU00_CLALP
MSVHERTPTASRGWVQSYVRMDSKTVIITGANQGIGYETALDLAGRGARVIMACRRTDAGREARLKIIQEVPDAVVEVRRLDLASFASIYEFARDMKLNEPRLDVLINNAAVMGCPKSRTVEGFDMQMGVNYIGHFLLTELLLDLLKRTGAISAPTRVIIVSSMTHKFGRMKWDDIMHDNNYSPLKMYFQTKLANIYHCLELANRLQGSLVTCNCLHPGMALTSLADHVKQGDGYSCCLRCFFTSCCCCMEKTVYIPPKAAAQTSIYCTIAHELRLVSGSYFNKCAEERLTGHAYNDEAAMRLYDMTMKWIERGTPTISPVHIGESSLNTPAQGRRSIEGIPPEQMQMLRE